MGMAIVLRINGIFAEMNMSIQLDSTVSVNMFELPPHD
ncbi:hypothetical protein IMCC3135_13570 [Granulosicoccus antarcticus IMCC3135]|uniref:Uncharacterized protein n=1 Tax=Granulosicoccus antarcticus IMCC3135 TaxID=1192854 RepID=A0A2Z2NNK3_9GAMM|nr:hypothetical protein IMCC3135_13570 [Granulosicoccus antarcticus IMCC3135]